MDDLLQEFIAETRETLEAIGGEIVAWEAAPGDRARLDAIFRFVHTVKGSCGFLDLPRLARLSHAAEEVLAAARDGTRVPDAAFVGAVLGVVDRIARLVDAIDAEVALPDDDEDALIAALAEGAAPAAVDAAAAEPVRSGVRSVRLNIDLLDRMMAGMSDVVLARNELARALRERASDPASDAALERLSATVTDMRDTVTRARMQRIEALFAALPRIVRDAAAGAGKQVALALDGADVELDREMVEVMRDPLMHIIRNTVDHGIEAPAARRAAGKPPVGRLGIAARQAGNQIVLEIADDGAGVDVERLVAKAAAGGRDIRELRAMSERERLDLMFEAGLSSRDTVSDLSGRGVGMDVVRTAIEQIGGRIALDNAPGRGLRITIHVPLTLSIIPTIVVGVGDHRFAVPRQSIDEILCEHADAVRIDRVGGAAIATVRDRRVPILDLGERLGIARPARGSMLLMLGIGAGHYVLAVDEVLDTEELVIKPAAPAVMATGVFAGQTLPDTGRPMLMLDCAGVAADAGLTFARAGAAVEAVAAEAPVDEALTFVDLDGVVRAVPLAIVDRIETVPASAIVHAGGALRLVRGDAPLLPVAAVADVGAGGDVGLVRLRDGAADLGYAMRAALGIVPLPDRLDPAPGLAGIAGVMVVDGAPVEVIDAHWTFARAFAAAPAGDRPRCALADDPWLARFLRPMLEGAGYEVVADDGDAGVVRIALDSAAGGADVRLRSAASGAADSIYRYDRDAILAAVARVTGAAA